MKARVASRTHKKGSRRAPDERTRKKVMEATKGKPKAKARIAESRAVHKMERRVQTQENKKLLWLYRARRAAA